MNLYAVILAGGKGERFWPKSRQDFPKQFLTIFGKKSLIQMTHERIKKFIPLNKHRYVISQSLVPLLKSQIPVSSENIIAEPFGKNTAPAIGIAAAYINKEAPGSIMVVLPADHLIKRDKEFKNNMLTAARVANQGYLVCFGIKPTRPETGYGYIRCKKLKTQNVFEIAEFIEKPPLRLAKKFIKSKIYLWNSGIFVFRTAAILKSFEEFLPKFYKDLLEFSSHIGKRDEVSAKKRLYEKAPNKSIDYAVMEKAENICVIKAGFLWDDVGSWLALERQFKKDNRGNIVFGKYYGFLTKNSIIYSDSGVIATLGIDDLIIVKDRDVVLVTKKKNAAQIKKLVTKIGKNPKDRHFL